MLFKNNLKDNLIVTRSGRGRRFIPYLVLLILVVLAFIFFGRPLVDRVRRTAEPEPVVVAPAEPEPVDPGRRMIAAMRDLADEGALVQAREKGLEILDKSREAVVVRETEELLGKINVELVQTPLAMPEKEKYVVTRGDSLERIARSFGTTVELLRESNSIRRDMIHPGDVLRVLNGTFAVTISKSRNDLKLTLNDRFFKRYPVGTGKHGTTPTGIFEISDKIVEPPWWRPDGGVFPFGHEENVLGTRWMSLSAIEGTEDVKGYGIHGTWEPDTIGHQLSQGCVRLLNEDVEELHMLLPLGTRVVIVE